MAITIGASANGAATGAHVIEGTQNSFQKDVIDASRQVPVLVDFWAPWCGPCRTLGPAIERVVASHNGKVRLVKINVDENQALAGQLQIQSIPTVYAFAGGQPVDGFMGALPESEIRRFVDKVLQAAPASSGNVDEIGLALASARQALAAGDMGRSAEIYATILEHQNDNADALIGLATVYDRSGQLDQVKAVLAQVPQEARSRDDYAALARTVALAEEAEALGPMEELEQKLGANPDDHQARFDLALALNARGMRVEAAEMLVALMRRDREWNEDGARKKLIELFEVWGPKDPATLKGRRLLSSVLFS